MPTCIALPTLQRLAEQLRPQGLAHGGISSDEVKASLVSEEGIHVGITNMVVGFGLELCLDICEPVLQYHKVDIDVVHLPNTPLIAEGAVGTAADETTHLSGLPDHVHGNNTRGIAHF